MSRQLNHSRYIDNGARDIGDREYHKAKVTPTAKQIRFYKKLYAICKANDIDTDTGEHPRSRVDFAMAIDKLIERLQKHGIDISGNGKDVTYVFSHDSDRRGRYYTDENIEITD